MLGKRFRYSVLRHIRALFSNPRLLFSKTQYTSDITSKNRKYAIFSNLHSESFEKKYWWLYIEKTYYQTEHDNFEQPHSAEQCKKRDPLGIFNIHSVAKYQEIGGGSLKTSKKSEKSFTKPKK